MHKSKEELEIMDMKKLNDINKKVENTTVYLFSSFEYKLYYNYYLGELDDDGINYDDIRKERCEKQGLDWEVEKEKKKYLFQKFLIIEDENYKDARKKIEDMFEYDIILKNSV